jgi:hypothetical protein
LSAALLLLQRLTETADGLLRGGYLLVADGEGFEDLPETLLLRTGASARVLRVDTELALRHALWKHAPAPVVGLVPESLRLPADLQQGAERRKVHTLSGDEVLSALLGTRVTGVEDAELRSLAIEHSAQIQARLQAKTTPTVIDRPLLERTLVEVVAELQDLRDTAERLPRLLARWVQAPPTWSPVLRRLAAATLIEGHGDPGRVLAWTLEDSPRRCRALLVYGSILSVEGEVPAAAWGPLAPLADEAASPLRAPAQARIFLVELVKRATQLLGHTARPLLDEADSHARQLLPSRQLQTSPLLPLAFEERTHSIALALGAGQLPPRGAMQALRSHALADTARPRLELLDDMARLVRYLQHSRPSHSQAVPHVLDYVDHHAHADRCVRRVERALSSAPAHHAEARALIERVVQRRDQLNRSYAEALSGSYVQTLFARELVALQNLVRDELLAPRAGPSASSPGPSDGRVFLLVLDGCSVPVFLDLLDQLCDPAHKIGLERGPGLSLRLRAGLSPLPTITSHARGALFQGAIPKDPFALETQWRDEGERVTDPARFRQNPALGNLGRQLFLKGDLADGGASLGSTLRGALPVVAAVFNAVDDRIGSHDTGAAWRMQVEDITGLLPALQAALDTGRRVLLTADHGHSPFRGTALRVGAGSTPRYLKLGAGETAPEGFAEIDCHDLAGQPGRMAFAWRSGVYRGQVQVGFHGGCSLEEMVVPVAWLARDGAPADRPAWWGEGADPAREAAPLPAAPLAAAPPEFAPPPTVQPSGPNVARVQPLPFAAPSAPLHRLPPALRLALDPAQQQAVAWILEDGPIRTAILAQRLGRPALRVQGWLVKINQSLTEHGAGLLAEELPDGEQQWRYTGPRVGQ